MTLKQQRVFIGIKVTDEITDLLPNLQKKFDNHPIKWVDAKDLHLTLIPPWQMTDQPKTEDQLSKTLQGYKNFNLTIYQLTYGPTPENPRMIWLKCEPSAELTNLKTHLENEFGKTEDRAFLPHITLARLSKKKINPALLPKIQKIITQTISVNAIQLFASPNPGEKGYRVLASIPINKNEESQ